MKNPYHDTASSDSIAMSRTVSVAGIFVFLLFLTLALITRLHELAPPVAAEKEGRTLRERLRSFEDRFREKTPFAEWREIDQAGLVRRFREGNQRVHIGKDGWLFYRPDIETVTGKGPEYVEPPSVARDPAPGRWQRPLPVIRDFARQLDDRGISLILVPVPTKAMLQPQGLGAEAERALPFRYSEIFGQLRREGVEVVDLVEAVEPGYLKQDTHWAPGMMEAAAREIVRLLERSRGEGRVRDGEERPGWTMREELRGHTGDLVGMLGLAPAARLFPEEQVVLRRRVKREDFRSVSSTAGSRIVLLGDSFVNVYEDPTLGFGKQGEETIDAGLADQLAALLGEELEVFASNGGGATTVRKRFAGSLRRRSSPPEAVVWVLSARDLFLAEIPGRRARIEWEFVDLPGAGGREPEAPPSNKPDPLAGEIILTGTLLEKSRIGDEAEQQTAAYDSAIYSAIFGDLSLESGSYEMDEAWVFLWAAKKRKLVDTAGLAVGNRYRLRLIPFPEEGPAATATQLDDFFRFDLRRYFAVEVEEGQ